MSRRQIHPIAAEPLNTLLAQKAHDNALFTVCELRDQLLEQPALAGFDQKTLRLYVRDQINKLLKKGKVKWVGLQPGFKHRDVFQVTDVFDVEAGGIRQEPTQDASDVEPLGAKLRRDSEQLRAQMEESEYLLQVLQEIVNTHPDNRDQVLPIFEEEKAQARALGEKLKAYAKVQQKLAEAGDDA